MNEFEKFVRQRFGCNNVGSIATAADTAKTTKPKAPEETPIADTPANRAFMARFYRVE